MDIDLVQIKNVIIENLKRSAAGVGMSLYDADKSFDAIKELDKAIATGKFTYNEILLPDAGKSVRISSKVYNEIQELIYTDRKIQAIKVLRDVTKIGLRDAKHAVEDSRNWDWTRNPPINY